jgi:hypothetical protein
MLGRHLAEQDDVAFHLVACLRLLDRSAEHRVQQPEGSPLVMACRTVTARADSLDREVVPEHGVVAALVQSGRR